MAVGLLIFKAAWWQQDLAPESGTKPGGPAEIAIARHVGRRRFEHLGLLR
jgi:hypothetical protein